MDKLAVVKRGLFDGLKITWELTKVMVPVYFIITFCNILLLSIGW